MDVDVTGQPNDGRTDYGSSGDCLHASASAGAERQLGGVPRFDPASGGRGTSGLARRVRHTARSVSATPRRNREARHGMGLMSPPWPIPANPQQGLAAPSRSGSTISTNRWPRRPLARASRRARTTYWLARARTCPNRNGISPPRGLHVDEPPSLLPLTSEASDTSLPVDHADPADRERHTLRFEGPKSSTNILLRLLARDRWRPLVVR